MWPRSVMVPPQINPRTRYVYRKDSRNPSAGSKTDMRPARGSAAQMRPRGSSISPVASTNSPGPSPRRPWVATCDPSAPKTRISCACDSRTAKPPPGSATRPLSAPKDSGRPPSKVPTRSSSTSINVGDGSVEGVLVTRTAPEGSVSRMVLQSERGPESLQAGLAATIAASRVTAIPGGILCVAFMVFRPFAGAIGLAAQPVQRQSR